ncbi:hypothetical protein CspHIS471_0100440 [Cutaneotrichosporon sp. HIS471]|nr:hypothetical protein CspHIS471_0100440 [Cutaneotrichosporon sp. HIS471]
MVSIPKVCRAAPATNGGTMEYTITCREDYPVPEPKEGELLVKLNMCGVCQSDHHMMAGDWGLGPAPGVDCTGHEGAGVVAKLGPGVDPAKWKVGERVGITPVHWTCGECEFCNNGHETICLKKQYFANAVNGTYTQYPIIHESWAIKLPDNVSDEQAAPFMCSGGTAYTATKASGAKPGNTVVVFGAGGGVGHMVTQFCKADGFNVIGIDVGDEKRKVAEHAGAAHFLDVTKIADKDLPAEVRKLTPDGLGAHAVIVAAGNPKAYSNAPGLLRPLGVIVAVGIPAAGTAVAGADPALVTFAGIQIRGILVTSRVDMADALRYLADGKVQENVEVVPFAEFPATLAAVAESKTSGRKVVNFNN